MFYVRNLGRVEVVDKQLIQVYRLDCGFCYDSKFSILISNKKMAGIGTGGTNSLSGGCVHDQHAVISEILVLTRGVFTRMYSYSSTLPAKEKNCV